VKNKVKISEAMNYKRGIANHCNIIVKMLDTSEDGIVLFIEKNLVNESSRDLMIEFVTQNNLNVLSEMGRYFISTNILAPCIQHPF
jgi:hypothetical protein